MDMPCDSPPDETAPPGRVARGRILRGRGGRRPAPWLSAARPAARALTLALALALPASLGCGAPARQHGAAARAGGAASPEWRLLTEEERRHNEESFDYIWTTVRDKHWDPTLGGLDWQAVNDELRPRAASAQSMAEARAVMGEMLARLGQSHFGIFPAHLYEDVGGQDDPEARLGSTGLHVRVVAERALVVALDPDSPAAGLGVKPGWEIRKVSGEDVRPRLQEIAAELQGKTYLDYLLARSVERRLRGDVGASVRVRLLDAQGRERDLDLGLTPPRGRRSTFGNLPPNHVWFETRVLEGGIGYIAFNFFLDPAGVMKEFGAAMEAYASAPGVVLDLRGNGGGIGAMAMGVAGWFVADQGSQLGTMSTREGKVNFAITPRLNAYRGPVAVLVDGLSASTTEILAGGLQDLGRARLFGTPTAGAALPSNIERLPNGDGFQYAIANYVSHGGQVLEGHGVMPDEVVAPTREALIAEGDPILAAALAWLRASG